MNFSYNEKTNLVYIDIYKEKDICAKCPAKLREKCPLLMAIIDNIVYPSSQSMELTSCILYESLLDELKEDVNE